MLSSSIQSNLFLPELEMKRWCGSGDVKIPIGETSMTFTGNDESDSYCWFRNSRARSWARSFLRTMINVAQSIRINFPDTILPVPAIPTADSSDSTIGKQRLLQVAFRMSGAALIKASDVVRSVVSFSWRLPICFPTLRSAGESLFQPHPDYDDVTAKLCTHSLAK